MVKWLKFIFFVYLFFFAWAIFPSKGYSQEKVAIIPFKVFGPIEVQFLKDAIPEMLYSRLNLQNKEIVKKEFLKEVLKDSEGKDELTLAKKFLDKTDFTSIILGSYTKIGDAFSLDIKVLKKEIGEFKTFFVTQDKESKLFEALSDLSSKISLYLSNDRITKQDLLVTSQPQESKGIKRIKVLDIKEPVYGMAIERLGKNGKRILALAGYSRINLYFLDGEKFDHFQTIELKGHEILYLNSGDFNKNGRPELFVTTIFLEDVRTYVYEMDQNDRFLEIGKANWYVKVINHPELGEQLIGQRMGFNEAFKGEIYLLDLTSSGLVAKTKLELPLELNLYQMTPIKYKGLPAIAYFDENDYLRIIDSKGKLLARLKERYDGSILGISKGYDEMTREKKFTPLNSRMFRISEGGSDSLLLIKNEGSRLFLRSKKFERGVIALLRFDEVNYKEAALSETIEGYISDLALDLEKRLIFATVVTDSKEGRVFVFSF